MEKEKKDIRKEKWKHRVCATEKNYTYIMSVMKEKGYNTIAGTLDMIINEYKKQ